MQFAYRWTWGTIIPNIKGVLADIVWGIKNVIRWTPVIWSDADFDWQFLSKILRYKLTRMAKIRHATEGYPRYARQMMIAVEILKRLEADELPKGRSINSATVKLHDRHMKWLDQYFGKIMSDIRCWWD